MFLKLLYILFIFLVFSGSNISIAGIALKYFVILIILIYLFIEQKLLFNKIWKLYAVFIGIFGLSCLATGYATEFGNVLIKQYFISYVGWASTVAVLTKDRSFIKYIIITILSVGLLDTLVTYSQFTFNASWYTPIEQFFKFSSLEEFYEISDKSMRTDEVMDSTLPGMFSSGVYNGYFLMLCTVLSLVYVVKKRKFWLYSITLFYLIGSFCCQQRGPFFISLLVILFVSFQLSSKLSSIKKVVFYFSFIVIVAVILYAFNYASEMSLRYVTKGLEDASRASIYGKTIDYIIHHPILPNFYELMAEKGNAPHNLFLNAFVYGGLFSFIIILLILFYQFKHIWPIIKSKAIDNAPHFYIFAIAWVAFTLNSFVHNRSIVTGEFMIWLIWGVLTISFSKEGLQQSKQLLIKQ